MIKKTPVRVNNAALAATLDVKPGTVVQVECRNGVPINREWRNRFRDAKIDGCITVAPKPAKTVKELK